MEGRWKERKRVKEASHSVSGDLYQRRRRRRGEARGVRGGKDRKKDRNVNKTH